MNNKEYTTEVTEARGFTVVLAVMGADGYAEARISNRRSGSVDLTGLSAGLMTVLSALPAGWSTAEDLYEMLKSDPSWVRFEFEKLTENE